MSSCPPVLVFFPFFQFKNFHGSFSFFHDSESAEQMVEKHEVFLEFSIDFSFFFSFLTPVLKYINNCSGLTRVNNTALCKQNTLIFAKFGLFQGHDSKIYRRS